MIVPLYSPRVDTVPHSSLCDKTLGSGPNVRRVQTGMEEFLESLGQRLILEAVSGYRSQVVHPSEGVPFNRGVRFIKMQGGYPEVVDPDYDSRQGAKF